MDIVLVFWKDADSKDGWTPSDDAEEWAQDPAPCMVTSGIIIDDNKDSVVVASSWGDGVYGDLSKIPRACLTKIVEVKVEE